MFLRGPKPRGIAAIAGLLWLLGPWGAPRALARTVKISWDTVGNADKYELSVRQGHHEVFSASIPRERTYWRGEMPAGYFYYSVRAVDQVGRPGDWTKPTAIVVTPRPPKPESPVDKKKLRFTAANARLILRWSAPDKGGRYVVEMERDGKPVPGTVTDERFWEVMRPEPGEFRWRVKAKVEAAGVFPPGLQHELGTVSQSDPSSWSRFQLEADAGYLDAIQKFLPPRLLWPQDRVALTGDNVVPLEWSAVSEAEAYEVRVDEIRPGRGPDSEPTGKTRTFVIRDTSMELPVGNLRSYTWRVRALANVGPQGTAGITSNEAMATFRVDPDAPDRRAASHLRIRAGMLSFELDRSSPSAGVAVELPGAATHLEIDSKLHLGGRWSLLPSLAIDFYQFDGVAAPRPDVAVPVGYRLPLSSPGAGWNLDLLMGAEGRRYLAPTPVLSGSSVTGTRIFGIGAIGLALGARVAKRFSRSWGMSAGIRTFTPMMSVGRPQQPQLTQSFNFDNNRCVDITGTLRIGNSWFLEGRLSRDERTLQFNAVGSPPELTATRGWRFSLGLQTEW